MDRTAQVTVSGRPYDVKVLQAGGDLWVASGNYLDREIEAMAQPRRRAEALAGDCRTGRRLSGEAGRNR